jgi:hypothetical protein
MIAKAYSVGLSYARREEGVTVAVRTAAVGVNTFVKLEESIE